MTATTPIDHSNRAHALCSASSAERWLNCPGSVAMSMQVPEPPASIYALEGTKMHELCEKLIAPIVFHWNKTGETSIKTITDMINREDLPGLVIEDYPSEMREYAQEFVDTIWEHILEYKPKKVYVEKRVTFDKSLDMFGTADLFFGFKQKDKKILAIYDIKYGKGKVVEADAPQLMFYALAVQNAYKTAEFDEFWMYIYQPRAEHVDGVLRRHKVTKAKAVKWRKRFTNGAKKALDMVQDAKALELQAGDHCLFCNAKPVCKTHADYLNQRAGLDFTDDPAVLVPAIPEQRLEIREFMSDEQISRLLTHRKEIEKFLSSLVEYAINRDQEGDPIVGWKVVEGRSIRKWQETSTEVARALTKLGVRDPYDRKLKGIGTIERELKDVTGLPKKEVPELIANLVIRTIPPKTLVPDDDPRLPFDASTIASRDFDVIDATSVETSEEQAGN